MLLTPAKGDLVSLTPVQAGDPVLLTPAGKDDLTGVVPLMPSMGELVPLTPSKGELISMTPADGSKKISLMPRRPAHLYGEVVPYYP